MRINPGLRVISLADGSVCIGATAGGLWIDGLDARDKAFIDALASPAGAPADGPGTAPRGSSSGGSGADALPDAERRGELLAILEPVLVADAAYRIPGVRASRLAPDIAQWSAAYGLHAGPLVERRMRAVVRIHGLDRCGQTVAVLLAAAGIGSLQLCDPRPVEAGDLGAGPLRLADLGLERPRALARHLGRHWPHASLSTWEPGTGGTTQEADAVVAVGSPWLDEDLAAYLAATDVPHLRVACGEAGSGVGPLVVPGATPCLDCAADAGLPAAVPRTATCAGPTEVSLAAAAAGLAVQQILMLVDGVQVPAAAGAVLELDLATGGVGTRAVAARPGCLCLLRAA
ncbi:ThiF family adenylyltransferase [Zafaria sp. Z1313]|uniref:ThiF family adenylyltransferase n=1 Tax=unclassified Zafaria TaxID=2828765 RepID=UPI002E789949|nr:hypothetical protein [Zafaria sp. J156]MEE1620348.1 hypothetical protein [Zafaria sp. J156]